MGTYFAKKEDLTRKWFVIDAKGRPLGRLATEVAKILRGKHKPIFTPHVDCGDHVIVVNADKIVLTGRAKAEEPIRWHSGYPGGLKTIARGRMLAKSPVKSVMRAVKGMLPHNKLGDAMLKKLRVYAGPEHDHEAQKPERLEGQKVKRSKGRKVERSEGQKVTRFRTPDPGPRTPDPGLPTEE